MNSLGINNISKTNHTRIMMVQAFDIDSTAPTWASGALSSISVYGNEDSTRKPYIDIFYSLPTADTTPPPSISNLANTTTCNSINWTWTNPGGDQNETVIWKDDTLFHNLTNTTSYDLWTSLSENTEYDFSSKTKDIAGNLNTTWVNQSATTKTSATASFTKNATDGLYNFGLQVNDTSTGTTLTSWNWSWGDATWTNTTDFRRTQRNPCVRHRWQLHHIPDRLELLWIRSIR